ncbi:MAG: CdaR family protein [Bacteroides sp.]|nr:CdaR family protein [Eubacterium sp.]MCM1418256.1 CdaR family protein [Roseburia sp.]MCM1462362.1 CdaR family protein [Bacteroides sp.]
MNNFFKKFASNLVLNIKTIIQAVVLSVILWFVISIQIFPNITLHVSDVKVLCEPTQYMLNENLKITSPPIEDITIQIQGKRYDISTLTGEDFTARCDLSGIYESGEYTVDVRIEPADPSVECVVLSDSITADVSVMKIITREITVEPSSADLMIAEGMQVEGELTVSPETVLVTGEERLVNSIGKIEATPEYSGTLEESAELRGSLGFYNRQGIKMLNPDVTLSTSAFTVSVPIYKVRTIPLNVQFTNFPTNFDASALQYSMSIEELTIASPDSSVDRIAEIDIGEISLSSLTLKDLQGGVSLPIKLPDGYKNISGNKTVTVYFEDYDSFGQLGFTVPAQNINVINVPTSYDVDILTNQLTVNVVGLSSYIQGMTSDDIFATVNLLGVEISEGTKSVSVSFRLTGGNIKAWVTGEEYKVDLRVSAAEEEETEDSAHE